MISLTQDRALAEQCLRESGGEISLAIVELLQLMTLMEEDRKTYVHALVGHWVVD